MDGALADFHRAAALFPLEQTFRLGPSTFFVYVRPEGKEREMVAELRAALDSNPFALDIRCNLAAMLWQLGETRAAANEFNFVKLLSPMAPPVLIVSEDRRTVRCGAGMAQAVSR